MSQYTFSRRNALVFAGASLASLLPGCEKRVRGPEEDSPFAQEEAGYFLLMIVDLSGSFQSLLVDDGGAWSFLARCLDRYFQDRAGNENDQVILATILGDARSLLFKGSPRRLREKFPTEEKFRERLHSETLSRPGGSHVHTGVSRALRYLTSQPSFRSGQAKAVTVVLSDFDDYGPDSQATGEQLFDEFVDYLSQGGRLGLYYLDQQQEPVWKQRFEDAGFDTVPVEVRENDQPPLPSFDQ